MATPHRRRLWGWFKKQFNKVRALLRKLFGRVAIPPPRSRAFWNKKWIKRGRYIGYFPGYANQKGLPYKKAEKYCDEEFGGLATIFSKRENALVFGICRELLKKYKKQRKCKRKCKYVLFRGTKCWTHCFIPKVEKLYIQKHWKGHNCWLGMQLGPSTKKSKAFRTWNDRRKVEYKNWSPGEPNYRTIKHCKKVWGRDTSGKQCEIETIYDEKCGEILAYKAGHAKVKRSKKQRKLFKGVPADIQQQIAPVGYARHTKYALIARAAKWNNVRCKSSRLPICQKPRGQVYDKYIAVRAARTYNKAQQFCSDWYGSTLATINNDKDNIQAMQACNAIDISKRSCWIGLKRPFKKWMDGLKTKQFTNWSPGEPNNAGYNENCVELYGGNGKWNDLGCAAKRYFLCNLETKMQRMNSKVRKEMILKRLRKHKSIWDRYRRKEYRKKIRQKYKENMVKRMEQQAIQRRQNAFKQRDGFRENIFKQQYGGFMNTLGIKLRRRRRRLQIQEEKQNEMDMIQSINHKRKKVEFNMYMDEQQMFDTYGIHTMDATDATDAIDVKCKFFISTHGAFFELCIDEHGIDIKKYIRHEQRNIREHIIMNNNATYNISNKYYYMNYINYMEYQDFKHKLALYDENKIVNHIYNDMMDSYHLTLIQFVYDFDSNHNKQCWKYVYQFQICLQLNDGNNNNNNMMIEIVKPNKILSASKLIRFGNNKEWNEVNHLYDQHNPNTMIITKCVHIFEAKICIECKYEIINQNDFITLSYIANIFIHDASSINSIV